MFSSRSFKFLCFMFRSMIYFELVFVKGVISIPRLVFFFWHVDIGLLQHYLLKRLSLLHCIVFALLSKVSWLHWWGSIYGLSILFHLIYLFIILSVPHCLDYWTIVISLEVGSVSPPTLLFSFHDMLYIPGLFPLYEQFIHIHKITCWRLVRLRLY